VLAEINQDVLNKLDLRLKENFGRQQEAIGMSY
jgi:hypothetical protein